MAIFKIITDEEKDMENETQLKFANSMLMSVWKMLDKKDRTEDENDEMINAAHSALYFFMKFGKAKDIATANWQVSRVYIVLKRPEPALYHAKKCLELCEKNNITVDEFNINWAYDAVTAAYALKAQLVKEKKEE